MITGYGISRTIVVGCLLVCTKAFPASVELTGQVLDADGKPVAGAEVASFWQGEDERMKAFHSATTGPDGRFTFETSHYDSRIPVLAFDAEQQHGALLMLPTNYTGTPLPMKLGPLVTVRGQFTCQELGGAPGWCNAYFSLTEGDIRVVQSYSDNGAFFAKLPPGEYKVKGYGTDSVKGMTTNIVLRAGQPLLDMGKVDLPASAIGRHYGKAAPPWHVTEARGLPKNAQPASRRGKWMVVEFWGFW